MILVDMFATLNCLTPVLGLLDRTTIIRIHRILSHRILTVSEKPVSVQIVQVCEQFTIDG